jgi:hypothetical protein
MATDRPWLRRLLARLQETELRLWHIIVGFAASTAISWLHTGWDQQRDLIVERSDELVAASSQFENNVNALVTSGSTFEELSPAKLALLYGNVEAQISALNKIRPILTGTEEQKLAEEYAVLLISVRNLLDDGLQPSETRDFGIAAQSLVSTRDRLLGHLS